MKLGDLFLRNLNCDTARVVLRKWAWLLGDRAVRPVALTAFGDWFLQDKGTNEILFLDTGLGALALVAGSRDEWRRRCAKHRQDWFHQDLHILLLGRGLRLRPGQCFTWKTPPCLGGALTVENFEVGSLVTHQRLTARLARRLREVSVAETAAA